MGERAHLESIGLGHLADLPHEEKQAKLKEHLAKLRTQADADVAEYQKTKTLKIGMKGKTK